MHLDRQDLNQSSDERNVLGQQQIPFLVFFSYLLSLIISTNIRRAIDCQNQEKPRKVHFNFIDFILKKKVLFGGILRLRLPHVRRTNMMFFDDVRHQILKNLGVMAV